MTCSHCRSTAATRRRHCTELGWATNLRLPPARPSVLRRGQRRGTVASVDAGDDILASEPIGRSQHLAAARCADWWRSADHHACAVERVRVAERERDLLAARLREVRDVLLSDSAAGAAARISAVLRMVRSALDADPSIHGGDETSGGGPVGTSDRGSPAV